MQEEPNLFELWKEYQKVIAHFNELVLKLRLQALGGVTIISAVVGVVMREASGGLRWKMLTASFIILAIMWVAVAVLDLCYFNRLLHGAIAAVLNVESAAKDKGWSHLNFSTTIKETVEVRHSWWRSFNGSLILFYGIVFITLIVAGILSVLLPR